MSRLDELRAILKTIDRRARPHGSNIRTKLESESMSRNQIAALDTIAPAYLDVIRGMEDVDKEFSAWLKEHTTLVDNYLALLRKQCGRAFSPQSDLLSSVIPEYICCILQRLVKLIDLSLKVEGQKDLIIELVFSPMGYGTLHQKFKRVDAAILIDAALIFRETAVEQFAVPVVAIEIKTNLDKNMIVGIENSVADFKRSFPLSKYFVISEFSDFDTAKQNYAGTGIDEIYILRKQKRSTFRRSRMANTISIDVIGQFVDEVNGLLAQIESIAPSIAQRLSIGRLIDWRC